MKAMSASEAVFPALERTWDYLFRPFAWERFLKLGLAALVTEGTVVNVRFVIHEALPQDSDWLDLSPLQRLPGIHVLEALGAVAAIVVALLAFYMLTQLRFAFFHCLANGTDTIRPGWKLYAAQAERLFKASVGVWLGMLIPVVLLVAGVVTLAFSVLTLRTEDGKLDPGVFLTLFLPCALFAMLICVAAVAVGMALHDFILPQMALEDSTFRAAWRTMRAQVRAERETFFSYFLLRVLMAMVAGSGLAIVALLVTWPVFSVLGMSAAGFGAMLGDAEGVGAVACVVVEGAYLLLGLAIGILVAVGLGGPLAVFMRNYALVFYGARYKPLGDVMASAAAAAEPGSA